MLYVTDLERAVAFYRDKLGFAIRFHHPKTFASLIHTGMGCRLDLHPSEAEQRDVGFGAIIYFASNNLDGDLAVLKDNGVRVGEPRREGNGPRFMTFWDSEGNALGLEEQV
jgi:predicted enzyme related to lactoylglutathione lyase